MKITLASLLLMMLFGLILGMPSVAQAEKDHHRYGHSKHYDRHDHAYSQHHYYKKHNRNKHKHARKHSQKHNYGGYNHNYNQPHRSYDNRRYNHYPQTRYNNNPITYPTPTYGYPANLVLGIDTGNTSFMLRY